MAEDDVPRRFLRMQERRAGMAEHAPQRVRVNPRDDGIRKLMKHPASGSFRSEGSIEWPLDQFTKRRLRDGSITLEAGEAESGVEVEPEKVEKAGPEKVEKVEPEAEKRRRPVSTATT